MKELQPPVCIDQKFIFNNDYRKIKIACLRRIIFFFLS